MTDALEAKYNQVKSSVILMARNRDRRTQIQREIGQMNDELRNLQRGLHDAKSAMTGYENSKQNRDKPLFEKYSTEYKSTISKLTRKNEQMGDLKAELESLEQTIMNDNSGVDDALLEVHSHELESRRQNIIDIKLLINENKEKIALIVSEVEASGEKLSALYERRADLTSDKLLGVNSDSELKAIQSQIQKLESDAEQRMRTQHKDISHHEELLSGLRKKLKLAEHELSQVESLSPGVIERYIENNARHAAEDYLKACEELINNVNILSAYSELSAEYLGLNALRIFKRSNLTVLPAIGLSGFEPSNCSDKNFIYKADASFALEAKNQHKQSIILKLTDAGLI